MADPTGHVADLTGQVALVTGATAGIGLEIASSFLQAGATVVINGRDMQRGSLALAKLDHPRAFFVQGDCSVAQQARGVADQVFTKHGKINVLVTSGGAADSAPALFGELPDEAFTAVYCSQFLNRVFPIRAALPQLKIHGGSVIIVGTDAGRFATVGEALHGGLGAAKIMLTKTLAREFARWNIRVNGLALTITTDTEAFDAAMAREDWSTDLFRKAVRRFPGGRPPNAQEVARVALFLASTQSAQVTGQTISVNGGLSFGGW